MVISGMGCVSPLGLDVAATWAAVRDGRSGIRPVAALRSFPATVYAPAVSTDPTVLAPELPPGAAGALTPPMLLFLAAVREALAQAGLEPGGDGPDPCLGVIVGTTANYPVAVEAEGFLDLRRHWDGSAVDWAGVRGDPAGFWRHVTELLSGAPASVHGLGGANLTVHNACASGTQAVGEAFELVRNGYADAVVAGGAEALASFAGVTVLTKLSLLSQNPDPETACRPFDLNRDGLVLGEGAGAVVLESLDRALERGAPALAEVVGFGSTANAYRVTDSPADGIAASWAIEQCLRQSGVAPDEIDAVSAHATSTQQNDVSEANALRRALGPAAARVPVAALKSMLGHSLSAAGAVELVLAVESMREGLLPPVVSYRTPDPAIGLDVVTSPRRRRIDHLLKNSFGFGGQNGCLLLRRWS